VQLLASGHIAKMKTALSSPVSYQLPVGDVLLDMNALIGECLTLSFNGVIHCLHCGRKTKKSYAQGYCYPCMTTLAQCDNCIMSPEKCHFAAGTCREPDWAETHCMIEHIVYLANSSGIKVGITRHSQVPTRWIDQGAAQALPIFRTQSRLLSGLVEVIFKQHIADKTDWRKMLKNDMSDIDLEFERERLFQATEKELMALADIHGINAIQKIENVDITHIKYPVISYPVKVSSLCFDKTPEISGKVMGIKGQYLILDSGVLNLRKYTSYYINISVN
jgi:hypothetical protein